MNLKERRKTDARIASAVLASVVLSGAVLGVSAPVLAAETDAAKNAAKNANLYIDADATSDVDVITTLSGSRIQGIHYAPDAGAESSLSGPESVIGTNWEASDLWTGRAAGAAAACRPGIR